MEKKSGPTLKPSAESPTNRVSFLSTHLSAIQDYIPTHEFEFDLIVIGADQAGIALAMESALLGAKVALVDCNKRNYPGKTLSPEGTWARAGSFPMRFMHESSLFAVDIPNQKEAGWNFPAKMAHNWAGMQKRIANFIAVEHSKVISDLTAAKVTYLVSSASFDTDHTILLEDNVWQKKKMSSFYIAITVGTAQNFEEYTEGAECLTTSDAMLSKSMPPGKTLIIGSTPLAIEWAGILISFGYATSMLVRNSLLRGLDPDMAKRINDQLETMGVKMIKKALLKELHSTEKGKIEVKFQEIKSATFTADEFDTVLLASNEVGLTTALNLKNAGVRLGGSGKIKINDRDQTNVPNIFALGDVASGRVESIPAGKKAGVMLARRLFDNSDVLMSYANIPQVIFSPIQYSFCGMSEEEAAKKYQKENVEIYHTSFKPLEWEFLEAKNDDVCYCKMILTKSDEVIKGFHYFGPNAGEIVQGFSVAFNRGITKKQWDSTVGIHPTCAEIFISLKYTRSAAPNAKKTGC